MSQVLPSTTAIAEDFNWRADVVSVGPLRAADRSLLTLRHIRDFVIAGLNRDEIGVLAIPDVEACRSLCTDLPADAPVDRLVADQRLRQVIREGLRAAAKRSTGSSNRVARGLVIDTPLSIDKGEITDKGSINQRAVLQHRADLVDELYMEPCSRRVILVDTRQ